MCVGKRNRLCVGAEQAELPLSKVGLSMPCITTELITMAAKTIRTWAATWSSCTLLLGDVLWGGCSTRPTYVTLNWSGALSIRMEPTLWDTEAAVIELSAAEHVWGGIAECVSRRAKHFINPIQDSYYDDGSILVDANAMLNTHERNDMTVNAAGLVRVDPQYSKHASLSRASWLTSPNGLP